MKCVIFDLDGTLLYTLEDLADSTNYALMKFNLPKRSLEEIRTFVGNGVAKLIERASGLNDNKKNEEILAVFKNHYSKNQTNKTRPYKGVIKMLESLKQKGFKLAINSNKYDAAVKNLAEIYFKGLIDFSKGECANFPKKPSPKGALAIIDELNVNLSDTIYVGDSLVDIQTAKNADIPIISVLWGYCDKEIIEKENNDTVNSADELTKRLLEFL